LEDALSSCYVLLAVIGPSWLNLASGPSEERAGEEQDFVRLEIETALARGIRVIPILVNDTPRPMATDLPESLRSMTRRQDLRIKDETFRGDSNRLLDQLEQVIEAELAEPGLPPKPWSADLIDKSWRRRVLRVVLGDRIHVIRLQTTTYFSETLTVDDQKPIGVDRSPVELELDRGASPVPARLHFHSEPPVGWISDVRLEVAGEVLYEE
jgi:hypothetical protein